MKKKLNRIFVILLVVLLSISSQLILNAKAIGTVYIRDNGSIEGDGLKLENGIYVFTSDIYGQITIEKDNIIVDGSGYILHAMDEGTILLENVENVTLRNIEVIDTDFGITLKNSHYNKIERSTCIIKIENSQFNTIHQNKQISLFLSNSTNNTIKENNITDPPLYGIKLQAESNQNNIHKNNITNCKSGINFHGNSSHNNIYENNISVNGNALIFYNSYHNLVHDNSIRNNRGSYIYFRGASSNQFFRNDFIENNGSIVCWYCTNIWDNGVEGNYWSDYNGTDPDGNGIGNIAYSILTLHLSGEDYDYDNYPLMTPITNSQWIYEYKGFYIEQVDDKFIVSERYLETYISPLFSTIEEAKEWVDEGTTTPNPNEPEFPTILVISVVAIAAIIGVCILSYRIKNNRKT